MKIETKLNLLHDEVLKLKNNQWNPSRSEVISLLNQTLNNVIFPLRREISELQDIVRRLEIKLIDTNLELARIRAGTPNQRLQVFTVVDENEAKKLLDNDFSEPICVESPTKEGWKPDVEGRKEFIGRSPKDG